MDYYISSMPFLFLYYWCCFHFFAFFPSFKLLFQIFFLDLLAFLHVILFSSLISLFYCDFSTNCAHIFFNIKIQNKLLKYSWVLDLGMALAHFWISECMVSWLSQRCWLLFNRIVSFLDEVYRVLLKTPSISLFEIRT